LGGAEVQGGAGVAGIKWAYRAYHTINLVKFCLPGIKLKADERIDFVYSRWYDCLLFHQDR
jgi:hypothetical protein